MTLRTMTRYVALLALLLLSSSSMTEVAAAAGGVNNNRENSDEVEGGPYEYAYKYSANAPNGNEDESQSVRGVGLAKFDAAFDEHHRQQQQQQGQKHVHPDHPSNSVHRVLTKKRRNRKRNLRKRFYVDNTLANALDAV